MIDDDRLTGVSCGEGSRLITGGVGGKGPAGGGNGLILLETGDPGMDSSIVECLCML